MPSANRPLIDVEHASDEQFQAWIETTNLSDLVDENGIVSWSFDDRCRIINFAIRQGRKLQFAEENNLGESEEKTILSELFEEPDSAS